MTQAELKAIEKTFKKDFYTLFRELKGQIQDDYRADDSDDNTPSMCVTIGSDDELSSWSYQTGDNSFCGGAYGYPNWAVMTLTRRSNCRSLANEAFDELAQYIEETE